VYIYKLSNRLYEVYDLYSRMINIMPFWCIVFLFCIHFSKDCLLVVLIYIYVPNNHHENKRDMPAEWV